MCQNRFINYGKRSILMQDLNRGNQGWVVWELYTIFATSKCETVLKLKISLEKSGLVLKVIEWMVQFLSGRCFYLTSVSIHHCYPSGFKLVQVSHWSGGLVKQVARHHPTARGPDSGGSLWALALLQVPSWCLCCWSSDPTHCYIKSVSELKH